MTSASLPQMIMFYGLSLLMAVVLGFVLATPSEFLTFLVVAAVLMMLFTPLLLRWHHALLIFSIKATLMIFFLPGQPYLWMLMAVLSFGFAVLRRALEKESTYLHVPPVAYALIALTLVVLITAKLTGGIGFRVLGSGVYGGKRYYTTLAAVLVYFALVSQRIPASRAGFFVGIFFLSELTALFSNVAYLLGPKYWFLYAIFPPDLAMHQAASDYILTETHFVRVTGLSWAGHAVFCYMLARYGAKEVFGHPWRLLFILVVMGLTLLGGFRTYVILFGLILLIQFKLERLYRSKIFLIFVVVTALTAMVVLPNVQRLPLAVQRSLSIIPGLKVAPAAAFNAQTSSEWRLSMWKLLLAELPNHLLLGKGYAVDPTEMYLMEQSVLRGLAPTYEFALIAGDYHNGPLSVIVPFGIWGAAAFLWFCIAGLWVLYKNWKNGPAELKLINTFFLAYFTARVIFFMVFFGTLNGDLVVFTAILGLNISLNGGVCREPVKQMASVETTPLEEQTPPAALPAPANP
ncbi:MAG: O-antigen ligase family protein [Verrucomicrobiae bacterium]|nr:O-antigen ligase family protein [Verrucomicrobiae bacterium]